ncbi:sugar phosphotransferase [Pediococcus pentosaceus]|uniref:hypothetical protein n=1 Tax=Pediococcus pentosaceus TaxID=1255 RepID=UPI0006D8CDA2|nr:hypothetical protein [Pediococcus pentosaceus]ANI98168.1 hypothetical protein AN278_006680 [Pediococcus pentosaceus]KQB82288.1 hypothetical protein AN278_02245 [Pediococcus pentosaceus]MBF7113505.1 sugar phosphotransferase [Pediococcus pentosaceus]MDY8106716.1 sugar phosphotransferase [Pediococcus pentosaceus]UQA99543.1 sugar phosphotransferase [Pediococcus pentosaceus]
MKKKIDFVVSWVNSNDTSWQIRKNKQLELMGKDKLMIDESRYHEFGFFKYWFRSVEKYAPWVNHVYLVTDQQTPDFLMPTSKVSVVDHKEFIPDKYLPTFSSSVIELFLDQIPNLEEQFVYFNDDMFINAPVKPDDFFDKDGLPKDAAIPSVLQPVSEFDHLPFNNALVLNKSFKKRKIIRDNFSKFFSFKYGMDNVLKAILTVPFQNWSSFKIQHIPYSLRKEDYKLFRHYANNEIKRTGAMHFRSDNDINIWLLQEIRFACGMFSVRNVRDGALYNFDNSEELINCLRQEKVKLVCINDDSKYKSIEEKDVIANKIKKILEEKFNKPAAVEKFGNN